MDESGLQILRAAAFVLAVTVAVVVQRLAPYAGTRGSVRTNVACGSSAPSSCPTCRAISDSATSCCSRWRDEEAG